MKVTRPLILAVGFVGGLLIGATSQAIRLTIADKQTNDTPEPLPKFLTDLDPENDTPSTGSTESDA